MWILQGLKGCSVAGAGLAVAAGLATYAAAHASPSARGAASAVLATASGGVWIVSAALPARRRRTVARLNLTAATLAALSGICLLP